MRQITLALALTTALSGAALAADPETSGLVEAIHDGNIKFCVFLSDGTVAYAPQEKHQHDFRAALVGGLSVSFRHASTPISVNCHANGEGGGVPAYEVTSDVDLWR